MSGFAVKTEASCEFAQDVVAGLSQPVQKELPSKYLYDDLGSALFEAITYLPEYGLTRADERLLREHAAHLRRHLVGEVIIAELGSGNGRKTRWILEAFGGQHRLSYFPVDLSSAALLRCQQELAGLADIQAIEKPYLEGIGEAAAQRQPHQRLLVLFVGSNIGNFDRPGAEVFLCQLRQFLQPGDALLVGTDLVKPVEQMLLAYDDPTGVTAAFNRNLLGRINRELDADFDLQRFDHVVRWNEQERSIEMHLRSRGDQTARIRAADFVCSLRNGETIWTEASHKFLPEDLSAMPGRAGFRPEAQWVDREWPFAESLWVAVSAP